MRQGYLGLIGSKALVRVRCASERAFLTIKSDRQGLVRAEYEYEIDVADAEEMLGNLCVNRPLEKIRYTLKLGDLTWEIDEYSGELAGLVLAEVELERVDQQIDLPDWVGVEVTSIPRFRNIALSETRSVPVMSESN